MREYVTYVAYPNAISATGNGRTFRRYPIIIPREIKGRLFIDVLLANNTKWLHQKRLVVFRKVIMPLLIRCALTRARAEILKRRSKTQVGSPPQGGPFSCLFIGLGGKVAVNFNKEKRRTKWSFLPKNFFHCQMTKKCFRRYFENSLPAKNAFK